MRIGGGVELKRLFAVVTLVLLIAASAFTEPQNGVIITIAAGTAVRVIPNPSTANPVKANSIFIQPLHGSSTGLIYVLNAAPNVACSNGGAGTTFVAELGPSTSTAPGSSFSFPSNPTATSATSGFDLRYWCIDGAHTGDQVAVSWDIRQ